MKVVLNLNDVPRIGNILYRLRDQAGVPQNVLSAGMLTAANHVSRIEHNRKTPGLKKLISYLDQCGCKLVIMEEQEIKHLNVSP